MSSDDERAAADLQREFPGWTVTTTQMAGWLCAIRGGTSIRDEAHRLRGKIMDAERGLRPGAPYARKH